MRTALNQLAEASYKHFARCDGNQHIASEYALGHVLEVIRHWSVQDILEVGLGIGSVSYTVLLASRRNLLRQPIRYCGTEKNDFCLQQLQQNLGLDWIEVFPDLGGLPEQRRFDLIIIDGQDPDLKRIPGLIKRRGIVFIEGGRDDQFANVRSLFRSCLAYRAISMRKTPSYGPSPIEQWSGGCHVIFVQPTVRQRLDWARNRLLTSLKYRVRRRMVSS